MSRAQRIANLVTVFIPPLIIGAAIVVLWDELVGWTDLVAFALVYPLAALGVTVGFHRLLTHRAFETSRITRNLLAVAGSMAVQGPVIRWVADHRKHHAFTDEEGDPHSPHLATRSGALGTFEGLWHAHVGWFLSGSPHADIERFAPDLAKDRALQIIDKTFVVWAGLGFVLAFAIGAALSGTWAGGLTALLWAGVVRVFLLHHVTWSINSVCHFVGRRRFQTDDQSRNVFWLALPSMGEAWHHNHHAFPRSAFHGLRRWEIDPAGYAIWTLEKLGLAWDVVRVPPERQRAKAAVGAGAGAGVATPAPAAPS